MLIRLILFAIFILITAHIIILPMSKRRPFFIEGLEGAIYLSTVLAVIATITHPFVYSIAVVAGVIFYLIKSWFVYGVSKENINNALNKAILATRASASPLQNGYEIDNTMKVLLTQFGTRVCYIQFKSKVNSKKSELTKEIFRKFIQNYFL